MNKKEEVQEFIMGYMDRKSGNYEDVNIKEITEHTKNVLEENFIENWNKEQIKTDGERLGFILRKEDTEHWELIKYLVSEANKRAKYIKEEIDDIISDLKDVIEQVENL